MRKRALLLTLTFVFTVTLTWAQDPVLNEFVAQHATDLVTFTNFSHQYIEISGAPNTDLSDFTIVELEGDFCFEAFGPEASEVKSAFQVGTTDANGLWWTGFLNNVVNTLAGPQGSQAGKSLHEAGTFTLLLVEGFSGIIGEVLDLDKDGVLDELPWTRIVDEVAVSTDEGDFCDAILETPVVIVYTDVVMEIGFSGSNAFVNRASRIPNGIDTNTIGDWMRNDDDAGLPDIGGDVVDVGTVMNTPGTLNPDLLPVEFVAFDALVEGGSVILYWQTASETNNAGFQIQKKARRETAYPQWNTLEFVEGYGTTPEPRNYSYRIEELESGTHVFRLKQVDFDGAFDFSPEVEVTVELAETFRLTPPYPNPFNPSTSFSLAVKHQQEVTIALYNVLGQRVKVLFRGKMKANETHTFQLDATDLPNGLYLIRAAGVHFTAVRQATLLK